MAKINLNIKEREFKDYIKNKIRANMNDLLEVYRDDLKENFNTPPSRTGRIYTSEGPFGWAIEAAGKTEHQASAEGEFPAPLTGELMNTLGSSEVSFGKKKWTGIVFSPLERSVILETDMNRRGFYDTLKEGKDDYGSIAIGED